MTIKNNTYLTMAKNKFYSDKTPNWELPLQDFICDAYVRFSPNVYGNHICEKIRRDLRKRFEEESGADWDERKYSFTKVKANEERGDIQHNEIYYEVKVSFLSANYLYFLRHLRIWQPFHNYLLCLIDSSDNFKPHFLVINSGQIVNLNLSYMNGTHNANRNNEKAEMATTIDDCTFRYQLSDYNQLSEDTFYGLYNYMTNIYNPNIKSAIYDLYDDEYRPYAISNKYSIDFDKLVDIYSGNTYKKQFNEVVQEKYDRLKVA
jgi:hypothetical protein